MDLSQLAGKALSSPLGQKAKALVQQKIAKLGARDAAGAFDFFLKIDGIEGSSKDDKHKGEIEILDFTFTLSFQKTLQFDDLSFVTAIEKSTPKIFLACVKGDHIKQALITCRKAGGNQEEFLKITLSDFIVSFLKIADLGTADPVPMAFFTLNYSKIEMEYKEQKADGTLGGPIKAGWNLKENQPV